MMGLLLVCLGALTLVAFATSLLVALMLPLIDAALGRLSGPAQARGWLCVSLAPLSFASFVLLVAFLPSLGLGADHCVASNGHHAHLCFSHPQPFPPIGVCLLAAAMTARVLVAVIRCAIGVGHTVKTERALRQISRAKDELWIVPSQMPDAFVLGFVKPTVYVTEGLFALRADVVESVVEHELAHMRRRDPLMRIVGLLSGAFHLPVVAGRVLSRISRAQEMAADHVASDMVGSALNIADALVRLAGFRAHGRTGRLAFVDRDVIARMNALLEPMTPLPSLLVDVLCISAIVVPAYLLVSPSVVHRAIETLLAMLL